MGEAQAEMKATGGASTGLKTAALGVAAAVVGIGYESAKLAVSFQAQMETLATQAGVPQGQIKSLSNGVLNLAGQVGFSPTSLAEALYHVESSFASVGITGPKAMELLKTAAEGAAVGHANLVDVTNALDAAVASGIPGVQNFQQAMGTLNATVGAGDMTMQDLADAFSTGLLATVKGYGLSITDVGAALATFGDNNIRGANAATDLRMAVQALAVPTKAGGDMLQHMGIAGGQLAKDMQSGGLMKALQDLKTHMDAAGVSTKAQGQVLTEIFGKKAGVGAAVLYDQLDRLKSKYPELTKSANNFGTSWAETQKTFAQKMKEVEATLASVGVRIGEYLLPILGRLADWFEKSVGWLGRHKAVLEAVGVLAGGALAVGIWAAATAVWGFTTALLANPVFMIVEGLIALAGAVYYAYTHFAWFRDIVKDIGKWLEGAWKAIVSFAKNWHQYWDDVTAAISGAWDTVYRDVVGAWDDVAGFLTDAWGSLVDLWNSTGGAAVAAISRAWDTVAGAISGEWHHITSDLSSIWGNITRLWNDTGGKLLSLIGANMDHIRNVIALGWNFVIGQISGFLDIIKGIVSAGWDAVTGIFTTAWDLIGGVVQTAWDLIKGYVTAGADVIMGLLKAAWDVILGAVHIAWDLIKAAINVPLDAIKGAFQIFTDFVTGHWGKLWGDVKGLVSSVWNDIKSLISSVLGTIMSTVSTAATNIWNGFIGGIENAVTGVWNAMVDVWNAVAKFFKDSITWLWQAGKDLIQGLINGVGSMVSNAVSSVGDLAGKVLDSAKHGFGLWSPSRIFKGYGINIVQGLINGIASMGGAAVGSMDDLSGGLLATIKTSLGINSPSTVFHGYGINIVDGLVNGMTSRHGALQGAVTKMNGALSGGLAIPAVGGGGLPGGSLGIAGSGFGTGGSGLIVEVYMDGQKIQGAVRKQTLRYQTRNSRNNLSLSGVGS